MNTKELEKRCNELFFQVNEKTERIAELEKENAELKKDKKELCHSISEGGKACVYLNEQLTKAKEIIQKLIGLCFYPITTEDDLKKQNNIIAEAKAFIGGKE